MFKRINKNNLMKKNMEIGQYVVGCGRKVIL